MIGKGTYASLERILDEMNRDFKFLIGEIDWQDLLSWMGKYVGLIGARNLYIEKTTGEHPLTPHVQLEEYMGDLPVDYISMLPGGVRDASSHQVYTYAGDTFMQAHGKAERTLSETDETLKVESRTNYADYYTYSINDYKIFGNPDKDAVLELAYMAYKIDDRGFPMIPDNERVIEGCKWFIAEKIAFNMWGAGLMNDKVWGEIQQKREWYMASAQSVAVQMTPDEQETLTRAWVRLNPVIHQHSFSYRFTGVREDLNIGSG